MIKVLDVLFMWMFKLISLVIRFRIERKFGKLGVKIFYEFWEEIWNFVVKVRKWLICLGFLNFRNGECF